MNDNPLRIIATDTQKTNEKNKKNSLTRQKEAEAWFERQWLKKPEKFNPDRNCFERERIERTYQLILKHLDPNEKKVVDIGCGYGILAKRLRDLHAKVLAVDIAENAIKEMRQSNAQDMEIKRNALPATTLADNAYDLVICADVIAEIPAQDHRLAISELSRLVKADGWVVCSTPLDIHSDDSLEQFVALNETELVIIDAKASYHAWSIKLINLLKTPKKYSQGHHNRECSHKELKNRKGISRWWYIINSSFPLCYFWGLIDIILKPFYRWLCQSKSSMRFLENACRFIKNERGISHIILIGKRKTLVEKIAEEDPQARMHDRPPFRRERKWE